MMVISPEELITCVEAEMKKVGYSEKAINRHYHYEFTWLLRYMKERNITQYTPEVGYEALPLMQERKATFSGKLGCVSLLKHIDNYVMEIPMKPPGHKVNSGIGEHYLEFTEYFDWYSSQALSPKTIRSRRSYLRRIEIGFYDLGLQSIHELDLRKIIDFCETLANCTPSVKQSIITILNNFLRYLYKHEYVEQDFSQNTLCVRYDRKSKIPSYYTQKEIEVLLNTIGNETPLQKRNYAMTMLTAQTGMRCADVVGLKFESIDWNDDKITFVQQKTGVETIVALPPAVGEAIADYVINQRPQSKSESVFISHKPPYASLTPDAFSQVVSQAFIKSGININGRKTGPHSLRHSHASALLAQGVPLKAIADELGHLDIQTTTIYAKIDTPNLAKCALPIPAYRDKVDYIVDESLELPIVGSLAPHIVDFILYKRAMGRNASSELIYLRNLSIFSLGYDLTTNLLPQQMVQEWIVRRENEKSTSQARRINILRLFSLYLKSLKFNVFVPNPPKTTSRKSHFAPHIYSDDELKRFFEVADTLSTKRHYIISERNHLIPTLFRVLLGCGLRISEALNLKIANVDLNTNILKILDAKYDKDRLVVMDKTLANVMRDYFIANSTLVAENGYVFAKNNGECLTQSAVYQWFRQILAEAGIPHLGRDYGPRIHDFRHTFSVRSLNQMLKEGKSLYNALPILKEYLGHSDIEATEKYVRLVEWMFPEIIVTMNSVSESIIPKLGVAQ